jgi:hypothetical protein
MSQGQWENGDELKIFGQQQGFPFPFQPVQIQQQMPVESLRVMDTTWTGTKYEAVSTKEPSATHAEEQFDKPEEPEKPKRGRPRKRKRKDPLSEAEQQKKREAFLDRNRCAASKCRKRKKESIENIRARARQLEKESLFLTAELMMAREEHARWLSMAIEHAKACPDGSAFQACLKEVEERMANSADLISMADSQVHDIERNSRSGSLSLSETENCRESFDQSDKANKSMVSYEHSQHSTFIQPSPGNDMVVSPVVLQLYTAMTRPSSCSSSSMTRKDSSSSVGNVSTNSSCASFEPMPRSDSMDIVVADHLMMLPNQRTTKIAAKSADGLDHVPCRNNT